MRRRVASSIGCLPLFVVMGAIGFNALFCDAGTVNEMDGSGLRALIGGGLGLLFAFLDEEAEAS